MARLVWELFPMFPATRLICGKKSQDIGKSGNSYADKALTDMHVALADIGNERRNDYLENIVFFT